MGASSARRNNIRNYKLTMKTFREYLEDWQDIDVAQFYLGVSLGIFMENDHPFINTDIKGILWSENELGNFLYKALGNLVKLGFIEFDEAEDKYRWKK